MLTNFAAIFSRPLSPIGSSPRVRTRAHTFSAIPRLAASLGAVALLSMPTLATAESIASHQAGKPAGVTAVTLAKSTAAWDQTRYTAYPPGVPEPTLVRITIAPNTRLDWHTHPMPAIGYVTSGVLTVERASNGVQRTFAAGQTITELVDIPHRGWTGDTGAELLVFYAREAQQPLSVASPGAENLALDETTTPIRD